MRGILSTAAAAAAQLASGICQRFLFQSLNRECVGWWPVKEGEGGNDLANCRLVGARALLQSIYWFRKLVKL